MYRIKTSNKISPAGPSVLDQTRYTISTDVENEDGVLVHSTDMYDYVFLNTLRAVARADTGTSNILVDRCSEAGVVVLNAPDANANAVKEPTVCTLLLASRKVSDGVAWVREQATGADVERTVEESRSQFMGPELSDKILGVIGLGAIGVQMVSVATKLGMTVFGYDPFLSVDGTLSLFRLIRRAMDLETIYENCNYITLHVPQTPETKGMSNEDVFYIMKGGVRVLNLAWDTLVDGDDMLITLDSGKVVYYVIGFPNGKILRGKNVVATPHLGISTPESEEDCVVMAAQELKDYLENGNIQNSVNLPTLVQPQSGVSRLCIIHCSTPDAVASIIGVLSKDGVNVASMTNKSRRDYAYTVADVDSRTGESMTDTIRALDVMLRVRLLNR